PPYPGAVPPGAVAVWRGNGMPPIFRLAPALEYCMGCAPEDLRIIRMTKNMAAAMPTSTRISIILIPSKAPPISNDASNPPAANPASGPSHLLAPDAAGAAGDAFCPDC